MLCSCSKINRKDAVCSSSLHYVDPLLSECQAHMLLLTHLEREQEDIPSLLENDMKYVQERTIPLLEEIIKIACLPKRPYNFGWLVCT